MSNEPRIFVGRGERPRYLELALANRHGLIAGATGTGKTVSLQILAEGFSAQGVPVFMADVKGDLSGISQTGADNPKLQERARAIGLTDYALGASPVILWDLFGEQGHPVRTTISDMGPLLLSRLLELNDAQEGVMNVVFRAADDQGLLLLDLKDLRTMLAFVAEHASELNNTYGAVSSASVGAIQRRLLVIEQQGAANLFGEPALTLADLMRTARDGSGYINVLAADKLMQSPGRVVRAIAGGRRSGQTQARVLFRRGASAVQRCTQGAGGKGPAGRAADPLQGRGRVLRHAESAGCPRHGAGPARQPHSACPAGVYPA